MERVNNFEYDERNDKATASFKVGNVVQEISFRMSYDDEVSFTIPQAFRTLQEAGLELDFSQAKEDFKELYEAKQQEKKEKHREEVREAYKSSWVHNVEDPKVEGLEFDIEDEESYVERLTKYFSSPQRKHPYFYVLYKGEKVGVSRNDVSSYRHQKNIKYSIDHAITDHKKRNYANPQNAIEKVVKLVDRKVKEREAKKRREEEEARKIKEELETLRSEFGDVKMGEKYHHRRHGNSFYSTKYFMELNDQELSIYARRNDDETTYDFAGLSKLSREQVQSIIDTLNN